ncbi:MAG: hypothetical protein KGL39_46700, partial [Patescibacteria group bacterium]|nr:hypothetical protein [Patescibacteria group bacterium]
SELQASNQSIQATLTNLAWLAELETTMEANEKPKAGDTSDSDGGKKTGSENSGPESEKPKADEDQGDQEKPTPKPEPERRPAAAGERKLRWL